jgi:hypothetical protein
MTTFAFECENVLPKIIGQLDYREGRARPHHRLYIITAPRETLQIQYNYDDAFGKLSIGRGNLVGHAQKLRQLGVKPTKSLAPTFVDGAYETDESPFVLESDEPAAQPKNANGRALGDLR